MGLQRELVQIVEIDIERCSLTYGTGGCTAVLGTDGVRKCFNTYATCQDKPNFAVETETLRFAPNISGLPRAARIIPALDGLVKTSAGRLNLGGVSDRMGPLGKRERVTVRLKDFADPDIWFDRYQAQRRDGTAQVDEGGYDPATRGTFFSRLRRRWPYYIGRALRVLEGELGQPLAEMRVRHYVIAEWKGPDAAGGVEIVAKDVLDLADNKKALCPAPSQGKLASELTATGSSLTLEPSGIGSQYAASGRASIGSEIVSFTRSGDVVTLTGRGLDGTDAASHSQGDLFQQAYRVEGMSIADVAADLLVTYAGVDAAFVPSDDWETEAQRWLSGFNLTATIAKPTGVTQLLGEIAQFGVLWWWDNVAQEIRMRANRPLDIGEVAPDLTDAATFLEGSTDNKDLHDERVSQVLYWHGVLDATANSRSGENFRKVAVAVDPDAEGPREYDQSQVLEIFNRWLGQDGDDGIAQAAAKRLLNRYRDTPRQVTFSYDAKDVGKVDLASPVLVTSRLIVDETGAALPTEMQITSIEEKVPGHRLVATAQDYQFRGRYGFITENDRPDYAASSEAQKATGAYIVGDTLTFGDGTGPYIMF